MLELEQSQAAAAVGQISLAHAYQELAAARGLTAAQVLLTLGLGLMLTLLFAVAMLRQSRQREEAQAQAACMQHSDYREAYDAFVEKRDPSYK